MSESNSDLMPDMDVSEIEVQFCRLCDQPGEKMYGIFDDNEDGYQIIRLIKENLPIVIYKSDPLSKNVCDKCVENLELLAAFKKECRKTQDKYVQELKQNADISDKDVQLYLGCTGNKLGDEADDEEELEEDLQDKCTSTEDLTILCRVCKQSILDASTVNGEVELGSDIHKIIAESLKRNHVFTGDSDESEKVLRKRKIQPLYNENEFDDSSCSDLTGFSKNTEEDNISQYEGNELNSEFESEDSNAERPQKRRKVENGPIRKKFREAPQVNKLEENTEQSINGEKEEIDKEPEEVLPEPDYEEFFQDEPEVTYEPLTLLQIALNAINVQNEALDYEPIYFIEKSAICHCHICDQEFKNIKLLALHERTHIEIELADRIDNSVLWHKSRPDASIRNKWLTKFDESFEDEEEEAVGEMVDVTIEEDGQECNLLQVKPDNAEAKPDEIVLVDMKPIVNGTYLGDYSKEERKAFYQCMRVGGQTKRFCPLCRYVFKDNWAIESHYFSLACYYTCKFCGMRFNKQRHRYDEHVKEHKNKQDKISEKIYTASKVSNAMPKIIHPEKVRKVVPMPDLPREVEDYQLPNQQNSILARKLDPRRPPSHLNQSEFNSNITIKQEPPDYETSQSKTGNQAYFCRKCYKVFFKLDEFNIHNQQCNFTPNPNANKFQAAAAQLNNQHKGQNFHSQNKSTPQRQSNGEVSSSGRPLRTCAKDMGPYKDEVYIPQKFLNEKVAPSNHEANNHHAGQGNNQEGFICHICGTPFPTVYSRNSHMRIHKGEPGGPAGNPNMSHVAQLRTQQHNFRINLQQQQQRQMQQRQQQLVRQEQINSYPRFEEVKIKQEPMDLLEPMVEISEEVETETLQNYETPMEIGGGAVSITPLPKKTKQLDPSIIAMVKNNPNISLQPKPKPQSAEKKSNPHVQRSPQQNQGNFQLQQQYQQTQQRLEQRFGNNAPANFSGNAASFVQASYGNTQNFNSNAQNYNSNAQNYVVNAQQFRSPPQNFGSSFVPPMGQDENKTYKCSSCWEAFTNKSHLYFHKKNQCEGSRFPCPFCKKRFGTEAAYSSHIFYSHPE